MEQVKRAETPPGHCYISLPPSRPVCPVGLLSSILHMSFSLSLHSYSVHAATLPSHCNSGCLDTLPP